MEEMLFLSWNSLKGIIRLHYEKRASRLEEGADTRA